MVLHDAVLAYRPASAPHEHRAERCDDGCDERQPRMRAVHGHERARKLHDGPKQGLRRELRQGGQGGGVVDEPAAELAAHVRVEECYLLLCEVSEELDTQPRDCCVAADGKEDAHRDFAGIAPEHQEAHEEQLRAKYLAYVDVQPFCVPVGGIHRGIDEVALHVGDGEAHHRQHERDCHAGVEQAQRAEREDLSPQESQRGPDRRVGLARSSGRGSRLRAALHLDGHPPRNQEIVHLPVGLSPTAPLRPVWVVRQVLPGQLLSIRQAGGLLCCRHLSMSSVRH
mmetsp:Transcript_24221/g.76161  ORF Transcript_24221/g.76161 Transcript_24221/m.76161 type:complete len:283 (-) Transcript_24221:128-976(-)